MKMSVSRSGFAEGQLVVAIAERRVAIDRDLHRPWASRRRSRRQASRSLGEPGGLVAGRQAKRGMAHDRESKRAAGARATLSPPPQPPILTGYDGRDAASPGPLA